MIPKNTGIKRLIYAGCFSLKGLIAAIRYEIAFRQAFILFIIMSGFSFVFDITPIERLALIGSLILILLAETINSAIECIVDRISPEFHVLSGRAKDYGSLAVFITLIFAIATWATILWP